jgi:eukaryotic-like serine/threonine-protein kinase
MSTRPTTLGAYTIERELGRGGMGIVYLARDPRLDRAVAIKVLPDAFTHDPERLARFEREARLLASLNHPNIGGIYGLEHDGDRRCLVLQYIPGDTLAQRLAHGPLPLDEALDVCRQIAAAVEAAHESGVIHRDLKPGNVKITPEGDVKVLDFGLAKGAEGSPSSSDLSQSPTIAFSATGAGVILGTAAYMSPEQARGKPVDRRTDIWSFGVVLYECLTGRQLFMGETVSDTIARILERAPDWSALPAQTPPRVRVLLERCLEKDPKKRLRDIGDARIELEAAIAERSTATRMAAAAADERRRSLFSPTALALAAVALVLGIGLGAALWGFLRPGVRGGAATGGPIRLSVDVPPDMRVSGWDFTPDGRAIVVRAQPRSAGPGETPLDRLYVRRLDRFELKPVPGTENVETYGFSYDGRFIVFRARVGREATRRVLARVAVDGNSPAVTICDWDDNWSSAFTCLPGGDILLAAARGTQLVRMSASGAVSPSLAKVGVQGYLSLGSPLPDGRHVFAALETWGAHGYQNDTWVLDSKTGQGRSLIPNSGFATWSPTGHVVFSRGGDLFAAPFDPGHAVITGDVVPLLTGLHTLSVWDNAYFVLGGGNLFYAPGAVSGGNRRLMIVGAPGDTVPFARARRPFEQPPSITPDGRRVAVVIPNAKGTFETWFADRDAATMRLAVAIPNADCDGPIWAPDGSRLAFTRIGKNAGDGVYVVRAGSGDAPTRIMLTDSFVRPVAWSPDGRTLLIMRFTQGHGDIFAVSMNDTSHTPRPFRATPANEREASYSPDGHMIAFNSDESGNMQVFVAAIRADGGLEPPVPVPTGAGAVVGFPRWSADGRRVFFATDADRIFSAAVTPGTNPVVGAPVERANVVDLRVGNSMWTLMPDGRLLIIQRGEDEGDPHRFDVVVNWAQELHATMAGAARR